MTTKQRAREVRKQKQCLFIGILVLFILIIILLIISRSNASASGTGAANTEATSADVDIATAETAISLSTETVSTSTDEDGLPANVLSDEIDTIIAEFATSHSLNSESFACFYYDTVTGAYGAYNEETYFTAGSTTKVPVNMVYYDMVAENVLSLSDTFVFEENAYEEGGGSTAYNYSINDEIPLSYLLEQSIVNSDNTAMNILISNLEEGMANYRDYICAYSNRTLSTEFYADNVINAAYACDVLKHLYAYRDTLYADLIEDMENAAIDEYLQSTDTEYTIAHKYGEYDGALNDYGIVFTDTPYLVGIFTQDVDNSADIIRLLNEELLAYNEASAT